MKITKAQRVMLNWLFGGNNITGGKSDARILKHLKEALDLKDLTFATAEDSAQEHDYGLSKVEADWLIAQWDKVFEKEIVPGQMLELALTFSEALEAFSQAEAERIKSENEKAKAEAEPTL